MTDTITHPAPEFAPEPPPRGPVVWARDNLFSSTFNGVISVVSIVGIIFALRGLLGFIFAEGRRWDAVTTNLRLLMVQAYPTAQFHRIWIAVGVVLVLGAISFAVWRAGGLTSAAKISKALLGLGAVFAIVAILGPFSAAAQVTNLIIAAVLLLVGWLPRRLLGDAAKEENVPTLLIGAAAAGLAIVGLYVVDLPVPVAGGGQELQGVATSTTGPITILYFVMIAGYLLGWAIRDRVPARPARAVLLLIWVATFPIISLLLLRDPDFRWAAFFTKWDMLGDSSGAGFVTLLLFIVVTAVVVYVLTLQDVPEGVRAVLLVGLVVASLAVWAVAALISLRILLLMATVFAAGASSFGGEAASRVRYMIVYVLGATITIYLLIVAEAGSTVEVPGRSFLGGLALTFVLAVAGIALSFPIGLLLALGRTSTMPIFRLLSVGYIELVRGVPLITWLIVGSQLLPLFLPLGLDIDSAVRAIIAVAFFSAAYLAENVRGGLQSIPSGQYEAARALGMTTVQMTVFITLPQALRAVIPALVGQTIAIFKDTSLVTIVSLFDFLHIARSVIPNQTTPFNFLGSIKETLIFAAIVYWIFTFSFSRASLRLEKKLGVGER